MGGIVSGCQTLRVLSILPIFVPSRSTTTVAFAFPVPDYWLEGGLDTQLDSNTGANIRQLFMPISLHEND